MQKLFIVCLLLIVNLAEAQQGFWNKVNHERLPTGRVLSKFEDKSVEKIDLYELKLNDFSETLAGIGENATGRIKLPTGNGVREFYIREVSSFTRPPAAKYGMIKSYNLKGVDDQTTSGKLSIGTDGVMASITSPTQRTFIVEPYTKDRLTYRAYQSGSLADEREDFECFVNTDDITSSLRVSETNADYEIRHDGLLRVYRLALACTVEFSQFHLNDQGIADNADITEKEAAVLSVMNTIVTRLNSLYRKEMAIKFELVLNEDGENDLIFIESDDFANFSFGGLNMLILKNQEVINEKVGVENYDIGHLLFRSGGGAIGLGSIPSTCMDQYKAHGVSGAETPIGDSFIIGVLAHEIGHQFGAKHVHSNNGLCSSQSETALEVGSGSTIMSYSGACLSNNYQTYADDRYNAFSINQFWTTMYVNPDRQCYQSVPIQNFAPIANAGDDVTVPVSTPLLLKGEGSDPDGNSQLTYVWEQQDAGFGTMPPSPNSTSGPTFRSYPPTKSPDRYLPRLSTVINGQTSSTWEVLPAVAREMSFSLMVRDNYSGGSQNDIDKMNITFVETDNPFVVTSEFSEASYDGLSEISVTWDVANTNVAPINCQAIDIYYSVDGGSNFDLVLIENTPNDGEATIQLPNIPTSEARIMVKAADNIFYNVNSSDFQVNSISVEAPLAPTQLTFTQSNITDIQLNWTDNSALENGFTIERKAGDGEFVEVGTVLMNHTAFADVSITASGVYTYRVAAFNETGNSAYTNTVEVDVDIEVAPEAPTDLVHSKIDISSVRLGWSDNSFREDGFIVERRAAGSNEFEEIARLENPNTTTYFDANLGEVSEYFYRVAAYNTHGTSGYSNITMVKGVQPFITIWSAEAGGSITIVLSTDDDKTYDFDYVWTEDGAVERSGTHTSDDGDFITEFSEAGTYQLEIIGDFPHLTKGYDVDQLLDVVQWGSIIWRSMESSFEGYEGTISATDIPDMANVTSTKKMFKDAFNVNLDMSQWQVGKVNNMEEMFSGAATFNSDMGGWDMSNVVNIRRMFSRATSFNGDVSGWDLSKVTNIAEMFDGASSFNQPLGAWDVSNVTNMAYALRRTSNFNQDLSNWNTSSVTNMGDLFKEATAFNQDISGWQVGNVTNMREMFFGAESFDQDLSGWNTSSVGSFYGMFDGATLFDQDLSDWDVTRATDMRNMFSNSGLQTMNYDKLLISWASQNVRQDIRIDVSTSYCEGVTARQQLIDDFGWTINDSGQKCPESTDILAFILSEQSGKATINSEDRTVAIEVRFGTDVTSLTPTITLVGEATSQPARGATVDFTNAVTYTVTSADETETEEWTITVSIAPANTETDIESFKLPRQVGRESIDKSNHTVDIEVASGTDITSLAATLTLSYGANSNPASGATLDFTDPVAYTVTAEDGTTNQAWTVTVTVGTVQLNNETDILSFSLPQQTDDATINTAQHTVQIQVATGTDVTSLTPSLTLSEGATSDPASGATADFTEPVVYTVTAEDGSTQQDWTVTINTGEKALSVPRNMEWKVFPNPVQGMLQINAVETVTVYLSDLSGRKVVDAHTGKDLSLDLSKLNAGTYLLIFQTDKAQYQQKILKQ